MSRQHLIEWDGEGYPSPALRRVAVGIPTSWGKGMAGGADTFLKVTVGISFLFGAFAVGHYFLVYLPDRDAALDGQRNRRSRRATDT